MPKKSCDTLDETTLAALIEDHGPTPCGQEHCKIEAANDFIAIARKSADPWRAVLELHVYSSLLAEQAKGDDLESKRRGAYLFELVERLGGIVFMPPVGDIVTRPGILRLEDDEESEGGGVFKVIYPSKRAQETRRKRAA